ncbi:MULTISPECIES: hypothetical protein [Methanobacterium]|jgi:hypothetical protein|uniref:Uncharacterized protein n=1 Tax=Methanobacterium veterum TaxID=408577 RepID=A0A9E5A364_9EURY|nr:MULTISPECIES: hypothetical protein [Methanobacterium]MCZ3366269.1 hypothetical protein [Methanobacterium veterum]MCZ3371502.1 hypothetical protein [Methanobacterium veterum]
MPYLICDKCNLYYEINDRSEMNDFHTCECGNELQYFNTIEEYMYGEPQNSYIADDKVEESDGKGIFYSVNKKNLVTLQMEMLKENKERKEKEHLKRDLNYKINHAMEAAREKGSNNSKNEYEPMIVKEYGDNPFKKQKEKLMRTMELLKKWKGE